MEKPARQRRRFRIGVVFCGLAAGAALLVLAGGVEAEDFLVLAPLTAIMAATGIGLLFDIAAARVGAVVLLAVAGLADAVGLVRVVIGTLAHRSWDLGVCVALLNAMATAVLLVWLLIRAIQVLVDRPLRGGPFTARLVGGALALIAVSHLHSATVIGFAWGSLDGMLSLSVSSSGTSLAGFPGWMLWHAALLVVSALLLLGRAQRRLAATGLAALFALLVLLVLAVGVRSVTTETLDVPLAAFSVGLALLPAYLAWWLRDEIAAAQ